MHIAGDNTLAGAAASAQTDRLAQSAKALAADSKDAAKVADVPHQFSKLLATMLVKEMRRALPEGFFGEGPGADIFDGWLDEHLGSALAERDGLRVEDMLAHSLRAKIDAGNSAAQKEQHP